MEVSAKERRRTHSDDADFVVHTEGERDSEGGRHRSSRDGDRAKDTTRDDHDNKDRGGRDRDRDRRREENERQPSKDKDHGRTKDKDTPRDDLGSSSSSRDRAREKDIRDRSSVDRGSRDRTKDKDIRERSIDRERDGSKDKDRVRERDRKRGGERGDDKDRDKGKEREREKARDREKERDRGRGKDREKGEKERYGRDPKGREHVRESDRDKPRLRDVEKGKGEGREEEKDVGRKDYDRVGNDIAKDKVVDVDDRVTVKDSQTSAPAQASKSELGERIMKMKEERFKRKNDSSEIASWVNRSRVLGEKLKQEKEIASRRMKVLEEQDNILGESDEESPERTGKDLAGLKILHGLDKVLEGGAVVLTLKDQSILTNGDINEEVDVLENVEIGEQKNRDEAYQAAGKKTGIYEDKFGYDEASQKSILPQYDEPFEDEGVTLDESGCFSGEAEKKLAELRKRIEGASSSRKMEDLTSFGKISSDYYTSEEMLQFKKPKKKKSLRKKEKLDLDALEAEAKAAGLGVGDLGSRKDGRMQVKREEQEKAEAESRSDAYKLAYAKAEEASKALRMEQTINPKTKDDDTPIFGDDYEDLQRSLEQARKLALKKQEESIGSGPQAVALQAFANNEQSQNSSAEPQENKVVITEMEEFVLGLQFNEDTHKVESEDVFMDEDSASEPVKIVTNDESREFAEADVSDKDAPPSNSKMEEDGLDETIYEVAVGKGLSGALKLLKDRGALKETVEWGGRNMDKKKSKLVGIHENEGTKEIHIERTDEFGRILTPKEAFRVLSHKFHGKGPGKMKQEKRMKQYQEELKQKQMKAADTPSHSVERMRETQARLKSPYLVLSGHVKPGQSSDPRSGFGTVEKDLGSLTPMLGDRKSTKHRSMSAIYCRYVTCRRSGGVDISFTDFPRALRFCCPLCNSLSCRFFHNFKSLIISL